MSDEPQSNLFSDPKHIVSDLNAFARFPTGGAVADLAAKRIAEILMLKKVGIGKDGQARAPRVREIIAAARVVVSMEKINQQERDAMAGLTDARTQVTTAIQVNIDTKSASAKDEALSDLIARTTADTRAILDAHGRADAGDVGVQPPDPDGPTEGRGSSPPEPA